MAQANDKYDYFIEVTDKRLAAIEHKLDLLLSFRMVLIGGSAAISIMVSMAINLITLYLRHHQ